jgi:hypothetical protein
MKPIARQLFLIASALCCVTALADAQFPSDIQPGSRVRVFLPEAYRQATSPTNRQAVRGVIESVSADTLRLTVPGAMGTLSVTSANIRRLEVSRGAPSRVVSAVERAFSGAISGAVAAGVANDPDNSRWPSYRTDWAAAGAGAAIGAGAGALVGLIFPNERWRRVRIAR